MECILFANAFLSQFLAFAKKMEGHFQTCFELKNNFFTTYKLHSALMPYIHTSTRKALYLKGMKMK
jgi:hypothetical protein